MQWKNINQCGEKNLAVNLHLHPPPTFPVELPRKVLMPRKRHFCSNSNWICQQIGAARIIRNGTFYFASAHWPAERFGGNVNNGKLSSTVCSTTSLTTATSTLCHCSCYSITAIVAPLPPQTTIVPRGYFTEPCTSKKHGTSRKRHICSQEWCILQFYLPLS